jgi:hypothetical protein
MLYSGQKIFFGSSTVDYISINVYVGSLVIEKNFVGNTQWTETDVSGQALFLLNFSKAYVSDRAERRLGQTTFLCGYV